MLSHSSFKGALLKEGEQRDLDHAKETSPFTPYVPCRLLNSAQILIGSGPCNGLSITFWTQKLKLGGMTKV